MQSAKNSKLAILSSLMRRPVYESPSEYLFWLWVSVFVRSSSVRPCTFVQCRPCTYVRPVSVFFFFFSYVRRHFWFHAFLLTSSLRVLRILIWTTIVVQPPSSVHNRPAGSVLDRSSLFGSSLFLSFVVVLISDTFSKWGWREKESSQLKESTLPQPIRGHPEGSRPIRLGKNHSSLDRRSSHILWASSQKQQLKVHDRSGGRSVLELHIILSLWNIVKWKLLEQCRINNVEYYRPICQFLGIMAYLTHCFLNPHCHSHLSKSYQTSLT